MKNLKKVLSLVLAATMATSLMSTAAFAKDTYADADKVNYNEAVDVMSAIGVFQGNNGQFNPQGDLTRESAAKIITYMLMGKENADKLTAGAAPYADVAADRWSAGAIAYCSGRGIIAGSNGNFYPTQKVTGVQFAKMLLVALGYDAKVEKMVGPSWAINTSTLAVTVNLNDNMEGVLMSNPLTREQAAQMAFNTMLTRMVKYTDKGTDIKLPDGTSVVVGASPATYETLGATSKMYGAAYGDGTNYTEFAEKYASKLELKTETQNGHAGRYFKYDGKDASAFAITDTVLATSTDGTDFAKLITKGQKGYAGYKMDDDVAIYVNGAMQKTDAGTSSDGSYTVANGTDLAALKTAGQAHDDIGSIIELIDTDDNGNIDVFAITEYTMSKVTNVAAEKKDGTEATATITGLGSVVKSDVTGNFDALAKDDYVMYAVIKTADNLAVDAYYVYEPTTFTGKMAKYNTGDSIMTIDGKDYTAAATANRVGLTQAQAFTGNTESTFYVDANGYVVAVDGIAAADKYVVVDEIAYVSSGVDTNYAEANVIFPDATKKKVNVDKINGEAVANTKDYDNTSGAGGTEVAPGTGVTGYVAAGDSTSAVTDKAFVSPSVATNATAYAGKIYTYKIDADGNYELTEKDAHNNFTMVKGTAVVDGVVVNNETVFVYKTKSGSDTVLTNYTGYANAPSTAGNAKVAVAAKDGYGQFVYVDATGTTAGDNNQQYIVFLDTSVTIDNSGDTAIYEYKAAVDGVVDTYKAKNALTFAKNTLYAVTVDNEGYISDSDNDFTNNGALADFAYTAAQADPSNGTIKTYDTINSVAATVTYNGSEKVYVVNVDDKTLTEGSVSDIVEGTYFWVEVVDKAAGAKASEKIAAKTIYVLAGNDNATYAASALTASSSDCTVSSSGDMIGASPAITGAAAAEKVKVAATAKSGQHMKITIAGAGDAVTGFDATGAEYTFVAGDITHNLTVTVVSYEAGKAPITNVYTISVAA